MAQTNSSPSNSAQPKRYLITGAKGFIGAWIAKTLVESGNPPSVFDVDPGFQRLSAILGESQLKEINFIQGDVTKYADLDRAVSENGITHILHLAGLQVPGCAADPLRGAMVNVIGTLNVFEVARRTTGPGAAHRLCQFRGGFRSRGVLWRRDGSGGRAVAAGNTLRRFQTV